MSESSSYSVWPFSKGQLFSLLASTDASGVALITDREVAELPQAKYLAKYLSHNDVAAKTIIVEESYIDGDYLEDFASYYVSCYQPYKKICKRLHFFAEAFTKAEADDALREGIAEAESRLQRSYLGFVVARPLPQAIIGRTVITTFRSDDGGRRKYPVTRRYQPDLFGVHLPIQSLAFQEQDTAVAACATVALWSAFHKTHELFGSSLPRPATITRNANVVRSPGRAMPSSGLRSEQVGEAVRSVGLEPEYFDVIGDTPLASLIYAYASAHIPVVLGVYVEGYSSHAVTVVGYSLRNDDVPSGELPYNGVTSIASRIDKFYVHDDGLGPFAYVTIADKTSIQMPKRWIDPPFYLETDWIRPDDPKIKSGFLPWMVMVPVYTKIRVTFFDMHSWLQRFASFFQKYREAFSKLGVDVDMLEWDLRLAHLNEFKTELRRNEIANKDAKRVLLRSLPRFLWRATLRHKGDRVVDYIADATDMSRSFPMLDQIWFDREFEQIIKGALRLDSVAAVWSNALKPKFYDFLTRRQNDSTA